MTCRLEWAEQALTDRRSIFAYIEEEDADAAARMDDTFVAKAERLLLFPQMGRPGRIEGTRELLAHPSYILHYEVDGETVRILAVIHTARRWPAVDE